MPDATADPVAELERWERSGGHWRVLSRSEAGLTVGLFTCDGGELMARITSVQAGLEEYVAGRDTSDD